MSNHEASPVSLGIEVLHGSHIEWQDNENYLH